MKSVEFFKTEIERLTNEITEAKRILSNPKLGAGLAKQSRGEIKRNKKKIEDYSLYLRYAETSPSEEYLKKEVVRITNRINLFSKEYKPLDEEKFSKKQCSAHKKGYEKDMGVPKLKKQLTAILFILK